MRIERDAPAKLNLTLEVLGRRADGYHEIASVMHTLSLCDTLTLELPDAPMIEVERGEIQINEPHPPTPLSVNGEGGNLRSAASGSPSPFTERGLGGEVIPTDSRNLIWKAVEAFVKICPHPQPLSRDAGEGSSPSPTVWERGRGGEGYPWKAILTKRIPTQAGLGGGSSDAAAALLCLAEWAKRWDLPLPDLQALAAQLGADVAFFVGGDADATRGAFVASASPPTALCALAQGKGERLTPLPLLPQFWWVLAKPYGVGAPTAWAYAQLQRGEYNPHARAYHTERLVNALQRSAIKTPTDLAPLLHNDFDTPILNALPALQTLRQQMEQAGALKVILCGSGAAQAALCETQEQAKSLIKSLTQQGYWAVAATTP